MIVNVNIRNQFSKVAACFAFWCHFWFSSLSVRYKETPSIPSSKIVTAWSMRVYTAAFFYIEICPIIRYNEIASWLCSTQSLHLLCLKSYVAAIY